MYLTRHQTSQRARWALDDRFFPTRFGLDLLLQLPKAQMAAVVGSFPQGEKASGQLLAPLEAQHEVWAAGVTYLRSREAREAESSVKDVYARVYEAKRPELFFKAVGWRVVGHEMPIRVREDSRWNVPEPELTLVINAGGNLGAVFKCCIRIVGGQIGRHSADRCSFFYHHQASVATAVVPA